MPRRARAAPPPPSPPCSATPPPDPADRPCWWAGRTTRRARGPRSSLSLPLPRRAGRVRHGTMLRMRILHLVGRSQRRGAELVALELAPALDRLGHTDI